MNDKYNVVGEFLSVSDVEENMIKMVVIQDERGACVMPVDEWRWVYGRQNRDKWKNAVA